MVEIRRNNTLYRQVYDHAKPGPLVEVGPAKGTGTSLTFWADPEVFETTEYKMETIARRLQEMAFLNKGLTIVVRDERVVEARIPRMPRASPRRSRSAPSTIRAA